MRTLILAVCSATLLASTVVVPAAASPLIPQPRFEADNSLVQVQHRRLRHGRDRGSRYHGGHRGGYRYHGHRGGHYYPDWDFYFDNWWWPGPYIYQPRYYYRSTGNAHVRWCYAHYRSYRSSDNTFQPYHGPRRQCISPYGP